MSARTQLSDRRLTLRSWFFTTDHKRVAILYLCQHHLVLLHRRRGGNR